MDSGIALPEKRKMGVYMYESLFVCLIGWLVGVCFVLVWFGGWLVGLLLVCFFI